MKKQILTLLALLMTVVTGAWAQQETLLTTILSTGDNASFKSGSKTFDNIATVTFSGTVYNEGGEGGWCSNQGITLTVTAAEGYTITRVKFYNASGSAFDEETPFEAILVYEGEYFTKVNGTSIGTGGVTKIEVYGYADTPAPAESIDLTTTDNLTWTLASMPGYDVELEVEYFPGMLTFAPNAIEGGTVEVVGLTDDALPAGFEKDAEGNIYVAEGTTFTLKAVSAEGYHFVCWSDDETNTNPEREITMPAQDLAFSATAIFAENEYDITFSEGTNPDPENPEWTATPNPAKTKQTVTVTYSGAKKVIGVKAEKKAPANVAVTSITLNKTATEITVGQTETLSVTSVLPANATDPTYTWKTSDETKATVDQDGKVTAVAAGNVNIYAEANDGSGVSATCAVTVTLTYPIALSAVTADYIGSVITSDGNVYPAKTAVPAGKTAVAMIAYVDGENHGLAIALADEGSMTWSTAKSTCEGKAAIGGNSWKLPSQEEWKNMFSANGSNQESYSGLNTAITTAGGTALQGYGDYWSSSEGDDNDALYVGLIEGGAYWSCDYKDANYQARACFAF